MLPAVVPLTVLFFSRMQAVLGLQQPGAVRFEASQFCPSVMQRSALPRRLSGIVATSTCAVECAASPNCSALHRLGADCYLATRSDWQDAWKTSSSCQSNGAATLVRLPTAPANLTDRLVVWLSLSASLSNLANSSARPAELVGPAALRNASGVVLSSGLGDSYLLLPPPDDSGLEARTGPLGQFSLFIKAEWQPRSGNSTYLVRAASTSNTVVFWAYEDSQRIKFGNRKAVTVNYYTGPVVPASKSVNSFGISYNGAYSAYLNGKSESVSQYSTISSTTAIGSVIQLGAKHGETVNDAMQGRLLCFAYWAREVSQEEFAEFDGMC